MENITKEAPEDIKAIKRIKNKSISLPGTRPNSQNSQLLISTGIPSLDSIIGGGVAVGTIFLIEDDAFSTYGEVVLKYFLAEGVVNGHSLYVGCKDMDPRKLVSELPSQIPEENEDKNDPKTDINDMKMSIAWRYQHLPTAGSNNKKLSFGHYFDLSKSMSTEETERVEIHYWDGTVSSDKPIPNTFLNPSYHEVLQDIKDYMSKCKFEIDALPERRSILRIALYNIGSPLWLPDTNAPVYSNRRDRDLDMFLFCLKALLRSAYAVAMIIIPREIIPKESLARCVHTTDTGIRLTTFMGTENEKNSALSDYNGFLKITKLPSLNTMEEPTQQSNADLAFKLRRKKFVIEKLHLPPELEETNQREQDDMPQFSCNTFKSKKIDF